jgi:hypothetical protein
VINMLKRVLLASIVALVLSASVATPGQADGPNIYHPTYPVPVAAPEFDSKLLIGGLAVTAGSIALLIERRRRRAADDSPDEG